MNVKLKEAPLAIVRPVSDWEKLPSAAKPDGTAAGPALLKVRPTALPVAAAADVNV